MLELSVALCLSTVTAALFLQVNKKTMLPAAVAAAVVGLALFAFGRRVLPTGVCFGAGVLCAAAIVSLLEKRSFLDGLLVFCVGGCQFGLWTTFQSGLQTVPEGDIVHFLYSVFYLLHIPAMLLTFEGLTLPKDWQTKARRLQRFWIPAIGVGLLALLVAVSILPFYGTVDAVVKILLTTAAFWAALTVMALLAAYGQKQEQNTAQTNYHNDMNTFINVVRSQRHDYNLHVQTVASLIAQEKWEECRAYVNALVQDTNQMNAVLPVKDPAVAALIYNFRLLAAQSGITLLLDIRDDMGEVVTSAYETNKIIGNLLQNALDELSRHSDPGAIELSIFKRGENCLVRVANKVTDREAFTGTQGEIFRQGFTTKQGHDGVGLSSIRTLAQSKGGDVTARLEGDTVYFVAAIPMRLTLE